MSRDLSRADPVLAQKVRKLIEEFGLAHGPQHALIVTRVDATAEEQRALYEQGRTKPGAIVTYRDGFRKKSLHQRVNPDTGLPEAGAVDLCVTDDPDGPGPLKAVCDWSNRKLFAEMGERAERLGLVWGGRWKKADAPHVELPGGDA